MFINDLDKFKDGKYINSSTGDFNDYPTSGFYAIYPSNSSLSNWSNIPSNTNRSPGMLFVFCAAKNSAGGSGYVLQLWTPWQGGKMYTRTRWGSTWQNWHELQYTS